MGVSRLALLKLLELAITVACLYLHHEHLRESNHVAFLATVTFVSYTIILLILLIAHLVKKPINKHVDIFLSSIAVPLFVATGTFIIRHWETGIWASLNTREREWGMWKGSLAITNGGLFLLDALLTFWA